MRRTASSCNTFAIAPTSFLISKFFTSGGISWGECPAAVIIIVITIVSSSSSIGNEMWCMCVMIRAITTGLWQFVMVSSSVISTARETEADYTNRYGYGHPSPGIVFCGHLSHRYHFRQINCNGYKFTVRAIIRDMIGRCFLHLNSDSRGRGNVKSECTEVNDLTLCFTTPVYKNIHVCLRLCTVNLLAHVVVMLRDVA